VNITFSTKFYNLNVGLVVAILGMIALPLLGLLFAGGPP
jgi:hypothetical protein